MTEKNLNESPNQPQSKADTTESRLERIERIMLAQAEQSSRLLKLLEFTANRVDGSGAGDEPILLDPDQLPHIANSLGVVLKDEVRKHRITWPKGTVCGYMQNPSSPGAEDLIGDVAGTRAMIATHPFDPSKTSRLYEEALPIVKKILKDRPWESKVWGQRESRPNKRVAIREQTIPAEKIVVVYIRKLIRPERLAIAFSVGHRVFEFDPFSPWPVPGGATEYRKRLIVRGGGEEPTTQYTGLHEWDFEAGKLVAQRRPLGRCEIDVYAKRDPNSGGIVRMTTEPPRPYGDIEAV